MELTGNSDPSAIKVYQSPTAEEQQVMGSGRNILLKHYVGTVPLSIAKKQPDSCELYGLFDGRLVEYDVVRYPEILSGHLANVVYSHRIEAAAERIGRVLSEL